MRATHRLKSDQIPEFGDFGGGGDRLAGASGDETYEDSVDSILLLSPPPSSCRTNDEGGGGGGGGGGGYRELQSSWGNEGIWVWQSARKNSTRSAPKPKWKLELKMQLYFSPFFLF